MEKARPELSFTDNINENDSLYRYMSLAQFLSLVENEELFFDYKLKEGICRSMNATILMKKIGIEI